MALENGAPADEVHNTFISVFAKSLPLFVTRELVYDMRYNTLEKQWKDLTAIKGKSAMFCQVTT